VFALVAAASAAGDAARVRAGRSLVVLLLGASGVVACANAPAYRPVGPPLADATVEAGLGVHGIVGQDVGGGGASGWVVGRIAPDLFLVGRGHLTDGLRWDGSSSTLQWGGAGGLRGTYALRPSLLVGGEVSVDYLQLAASDGSLQQYVSGVAAFPVAEEAFPDFWVYVQPTIGAGFRFGDVDVPFGGFTEMPIGIAWRPRPWLLLVGEGGLSLPFTGGYLGLAAALRL
jgi:hypothetical protein